MKKLYFLLSFMLFLFVQTFGQVSDEQVIKMVQDAQKQGMSQQQIALTLAQKGVTKEQMERLKKVYDEQTSGIVGANGKKTISGDRTRKVPVDKKDDKNQTQRELLDRRFLKEQKEKLPDMFETSEDESKMSLIDSINLEMEINKRLERMLKEREKKVFGRDIFNNKLLTFEPQLNIATPDNYILGPGDEVIIDIWGASENNIRQTISPDGKIVVEGVGPIHLSGLTSKDANNKVRSELGRIYSGILSGNTSLKLTLGEIRSIQVNVMGEVLFPGTYTLPSLASAFHALYNAGGVSQIGSLRSMKIYRHGKELVDVDIYDYILRGKNDLNIMLRDGDVIVVSPYKNLVEFKGKIKRPMFYEMKDTEVVTDILDYAGGFMGDAYKKSVRILRKSGREYQIYNVDEDEFSDFHLNDGDIVSVDSVIPRFENKVEVRGAFYREGLYALGEKVATVKELINKAEGLRGDAFLNRAVLYREKSDLTLEVLSIDIAGLLDGKVEDIQLRKNDVLYIPSIFDLQEDFTISVRGAVGHPGIYKYVDNMTLEDLVVQSGGLLEAASTVKVDVARRIKDPKSTNVSDMRAETFTFTLRDGLLVGGEQGFILKPFDEVFVRRSPGYQEQQNVSVEGEVMFAGDYSLAKKGERLSDLIKRAGGVTSEAYLQGARLSRKMTKDEQAKLQSMLKLSKQGGRDSVSQNQLQLEDTYFVGIELQEALNKPGSDFDIILKEGDKLEVPEFNGTVRISGAVMYPNTVVYKNKAKLKHYISQSGGYAQRAKKSRAFVIYMNGTVTVAKGGRTPIKPGCEIIVPMKQFRKGMGLAEIMSLASSTTSMAAMITSIMK